MNNLAKTFKPVPFKTPKRALITLLNNQPSNFDSLKLKFLSIYVAESLLPVVFINENMEIELAPKIRRDLTEAEWKELPSDLKQFILKEFYEQL